MPDCDSSSDAENGGHVAVQGGPTIRRRRLGAELRRLREAAGKGIDDAARQLGCSLSKVSRMENGRVPIRGDDVGDLLDLYQVDDPEQRQALLALTKETRRAGWWHTYGDVVPRWFEVYVGLEAEASSIAKFEALLVPGLLQTADYARAVMRAAPRQPPNPDVERAIELRLGRQAVLSTDPVPDLWVVIDEAVIRRVVGGPTVMRAQLDHLRRVSTRPNVTIQVVPFTGGAHAGMDSPFTLLGFSDADNLPEIVYIDQATGSLYLDRPGDVALYREKMDRLRASAYDELTSQLLIARAMEGIEDEPAG
ncbi:helix-turn-helix transcriptional regulator [Frankia sp. Cr2]|uniref:helix-turn-helix domain-containing protein n=1 Tax=Frankia sp. Cr2 TaxID=3073932 RepID=UPI002AD33D5B|nr:helix-turn-helix transcriptional regulator [Frankia sp. Cr2]